MFQDWLQKVVKRKRAQQIDQSLPKAGEEEKSSSDGPVTSQEK